MNIVCPRCGETHEIIDDNGDGGTFTCSSCSNVVIVPPLKSSVARNTNFGEYDFSRLICKNCGKRINTEHLHAGEEFNCPFCKTLNKVGQNLKTDIKMNALDTGATLSSAGVAVSTRENPDGSIPKILGKCKIEEIIGSGAMGYVFKATHTTLNIAVAIKVLRDEFSNVKNYSDRFVREAQTAAKLNHQNIIRVYDCGYENNMLYLVMEYVDGGSLAELLDKRGVALEPEQVIDIGIAISQALVEAEKYAIIHRDIKPANIMMTSDGVIKLADLGLAKQVRPIKGKKSITITMDIVAMGTPVYMPPEQALDAKKCDIRSDIYALGITLYHLLTGTPPFLSENQDALFKQHITEFARPASELNPAVPHDLDTIIFKCIMKKPEERYQSPKELLTDLNLLKMGQALRFAILAPLGQNSQEKTQKPPTKILEEKKTTAPPKTKKFLFKVFATFLVFAIIAVITINLVILFKGIQHEENADTNPGFPDLIKVSPDIPLVPEEPIETKIPAVPKDKTIQEPDEILRSNKVPKTNEAPIEKVSDSPKAPPLNEDKTEDKRNAGEEQQFNKMMKILRNINLSRNEILGYDTEAHNLWEKILRLSLHGDWTGKADDMSSLINESNHSNQIKNFLNAIKFSFTVVAQMSQEEILSSFNGHIVDFNKENSFAEFKYLPKTRTDEFMEMKGHFSVEEGKYAFDKFKGKISFNMPLVYNPHTQDNPPISLSAIIEKIPIDSGIAVKWNACMEMDDIKNLPQNIEIYFVISRKQKNVAKILVKQFGEDILTEEKLIPEGLLDKAFHFTTTIKPLEVQMEIGNIFKLKNNIKADGILLSPELMYPEIISTGAKIISSEIEISGRILPCWLSAKIASKIPPDKAKKLYKKQDTPHAPR